MQYDSGWPRTPLGAHATSVRTPSRSAVRQPNRSSIPSLASWCGMLGIIAGAHAAAAQTYEFIPLVSDSARVFTVPPLGKPDYLAPVQDPTFGTKLVRITGNPGDSIGANAPIGTWATDARHHANYDQPWNSDGTLLAIQNRGDPTRLILDGETYQPKYGRCPGYTGDDRWHPSLAHPHERIAVQAGQLMWYDVTQCVKTRQWSLPFPVNYLGYGNPSADGRFIALADTSRVFVVDMDPQAPFAAYPAQRIGPVFDLSACSLASGCKVQWVSVSPSARYVVAGYAGGQIRVLDVDPASLALSPRAFQATIPLCDGDPAQGFVYEIAQGDLTQNPFDANEDVLVGQEHCGKRGQILNGRKIGGVVMVRLRDGALTSLTDPTNEAVVQTVSARNDRRPGWVYVGYYPQYGKRFSDEIVALKLDGSGSVQRLAHKRSASVGCYRCVPQPVPSPDGMRVLWASNWAQGCGPCGAPTTIGAYIADARQPIGPPNLPPVASINRPAANVTIVASDSVTLAGSGSDPDGDLPLRFHWDLGRAGRGFDVEDPGSVEFDNPGTYVISLIVTDARGLSDTAATRTITVLPRTTPGHEVHWTITGPNSVTFDWREGSEFMRYGLDTNYGNVVRAQPPQPRPFSSAGPFREARLPGLLPDAVYHYSIGYGPDHTFRTPPPRGTSDFDTYVAADIGSTVAYQATIPVLHSIIASDLPRFCLLPGDLSYGNSHGQRAVERHFDDMMAWSQDAAYMPAWGNHEWDEPTHDDLRNYKGRFDLPNPQTSPGSPLVSCCGEDWYWFDYGNVRFIAYPEPWVGAWADWRTHAGELMSAAQRDPAIEFIVTFGHRPAYSSGHHPGSSTLQAHLDALGKAYDKYVLDLCGHSHNYERTYPQYGVVHVTTGGGGSGLESDVRDSCVWRAGCPPPAWSAFRAMHHEVLKLHFGPRSIEGWAICGPSNSRNDVSCTLGSPMDHFLITPRSDTLPPPVNLARNASFETSLSGWVPYGPIRLDRVAGGKDGAFCAEVTGDSTTTWFGLNDAPNWVDSTLAAGERYQFAAWMRTASGRGRAHLRVREYAGGVLKAAAVASPDVALTTGWQQLTLSYATAVGGSTLDFQAQFDPQGSEPRAQIDAVSIERLPSAPRAETETLSDDPSTWDEDELEDGGGAATLGQREAEMKFAARLYPSPLHDRSVLSFSTTRRGPAQVTLYDVSGRAVRALVPETDLGPGRHDVAIDGRDDRGARLAPGVYLYRVRAREGTLTGRCVILP